MSAMLHGLSCVSILRGPFFYLGISFCVRGFLGAKYFSPPTKKQKWSSLRCDIRWFWRTHETDDLSHLLDQQTIQQLTRRFTLWTTGWGLLGTFGMKMIRIWVINRIFLGGKNAHFPYLFSLDGGRQWRIETQQSANTRREEQLVRLVEGGVRILVESWRSAHTPFLGKKKKTGTAPFFWNKKC